MAYYTPGQIKSIQRGTITIAANQSSATATITSVDTSKAELRLLGFYVSTMDTDTPTINIRNHVYVTLANATTVSALRHYADTSGVATVSYEVVERY